MSDEGQIASAPSGSFEVNPTDPTGTANRNVNCSNPLVRAQEAAVLCTLPENADSYTLGPNLAQTFLPSFAGSIDYCHVTVARTVGIIPAPLVLQNCLQTGDPTYCSVIARDSAGSITGASVATHGGIQPRTSLNAL